jgi:predicted nucleic acid-binding protein
VGPRRWRGGARTLTVKQLTTAGRPRPRVETTAEHLHRALQVQRLLAERSQRGRKIPDLLIAAAAEQLALTVLHYDGDFDAIAAVTGQRCQWVVPAGSVP